MDRVLYWFLKWVGLGPIMRLVWRPRVEGSASLPRSGPVIIASNHLSFIDSFFLALMVRRRVTFLAKAEYFTKPGVKGWLSKRFFAGTGQVPIDRTGADAAQGALDTGLRVLAGGSMLGIYPEGTRSPDGKLYRGKTGVARLALASGAPVVPCAVIGTDALQPPGRLMPRLRPRPPIAIRAGAGVLRSRRGSRPTGGGAGHHQRDHRGHREAIGAGVCGRVRRRRKGQARRPAGIRLLLSLPARVARRAPVLL